MATALRSQRQTSGWKTFLRPGWILTAVLVIAFSYFAIWVLSPWQLNKDDALVNRNEHVERAFQVDPMSYGEIFDSNGAIKDDQEWMRVTVTGEFISDEEVLLRMRPVESTPVFQSLTPFRLDSGELLLVNRGWEPTSPGDVPNVPAPPSGEVTITGHARYNEVFPSTAPMNDHGYAQVYGINTDQISDITGLDLGQDFIQLTDSSTGVVNAMPLPKMDRGNHLSYGLQWIAFGVMAPLGLGYFIYSEIRERKRTRAEEAEMERATNDQAVITGPGDHDASEPSNSAEISDPNVQKQPEERSETGQEATQSASEASEAEDYEKAHSQRMRSRYGDSHKNYFEKRRGGTFN